VRFRFPFKRRQSYGLNHILGTGQSLALGTYGSPVLSETQPYNNKMFSVPCNPLTLTSLNDLIEDTQESMSSGLSNFVTSLAPTHDALVSVSALGGTDYNGLKKGTTAYDDAIDQVTAGLARAGELEVTYGVTAITVVHGEADGQLDPPTPNYDDMVTEWQADYQADIQAITGQTETIPLFHTQMSALTDSDIPLAQLRAHISAPGRVILVGPKYHFPNVDGSHLTNHGYRQLGEYHAKVYHKVIVLGEVWQPLRPRNVSIAGAVITIQFYVPEPPLVLDTDLVDPATNYGFIWDGGGEAITSVDIVSDDTVTITLDGTPAAPGQIKYAQQPAATNAGNLRDSDATESLHGYALYNWCVHFSETVEA